MSLPAIPDEALRAADEIDNEVWWISRHNEEALAAAWPHLYAAALRHAADHAAPDDYAHWRTELRRLADDAAPPTG